MVYTITKVDSAQDGSVFWEIIFSFAVSLPFFTLGIETALCEPFNDAFTFNNLMLEWYQTALLVAAAVAAPVFAWVSQRWGRKVGYYCICLIQGLVFIPVFVSTHESLPYTYILIGLSSGGIFTVLLPYIKELTSSKTRGVCLTLTGVMMMIGYQLRVLVKEFYDPMSFVVLTMVGLQMLMMMVLVESPSWLVLVGKNEHAVSSLAFLRRLPEDSPAISKEIGKLIDESKEADGKTTLLTLYRNKIQWDSIKIGFLLYTAMEFCGSVLFLDNKNACDCGISLQNPNVIVGFVLAGLALAFGIVVVWDRKYILTVGHTTMALSLGVYAVFSQLEGPGAVGEMVAVTTGLALPVVLVAYGMANWIPSIVVVELFNIKICTPILATLFTYSQLLMLLQTHMFFYLEHYIGIHALFYIYAGVNLYGGVYSLFVLPNIRNKNLKEIEHQVKRVPLPA